MPHLPNDPHRPTPYANFRFRMKWGDTYVLGVSKVSGLGRETQVITHRAGDDPSTVRVAPGQTDATPITMERGVSYDAAFAQWASKAFDYKNTAAVGQAASLNDIRKDLTLELYNEAGQKVVAYAIHRAWVSKLIAMPELDGTGNGLVVESIVLQCEGWERENVAASAEPSFTPPDA